ncbi:MAG TPA: hypothetical protein VF306_11995 [Pirellulales bacterium]
MTVRQAAADYPGCREVFARHGEPERPGVKFGHLEPIERFAARRGMAAATLLAELAAASGAATDFRGAAQRNAHRPFLAAALMCTLSLGVGWGGWLLWQIGREGSFAAVPDRFVVAHGEAQLWGFIAPFIMGIAVRYLPTATGRKPIAPALARVLLLALFAGVAGSFAALLLPSQVGWLGLTSGGLLWLASAGFLGIVLAQTGGKMRLTWARLVSASAGWLLAWATLLLALRAGQTADAPLYSEHARLLLLQFAVFGFALNAIYGFGLRLLPGFLGAGSPRATPIELNFWLHNAGSLALNAAPQSWPWLRAAGAMLIAVGAASYATGMRGFRRRGRPPPDDSWSASRPEIGVHFLRYYVQCAFGWLLVGLLILTAESLRGAMAGAAPSHSVIGAARHALAVGFMTTLILGVGQRLLPILGQTLLAWPRLVKPIFFLIQSGCALRVTSELATAVWPTAYAVMPYSAPLELTALVLFAANCLRTLWPPADPLLTRGAVTARSSLKTLLAEQPALEDKLIGWGFGYLARTRAVPGELTVGSFAAGEGRNAAETIERINAWLAERASIHQPEA